MLKTLKLNAEGHRSMIQIASFSGSSSQSMASSECREEIVIPKLLQKDQQSPLLDKMFKDLVSSHCGSQNYGSNSLSPSSAVNSPIQNSGQPTAPLESPPSNLFQAGFQDCTAEVLRFLKEQEKMDVQNPLLQGLRSHLMNVSKSISANDLSLAPSAIVTNTSHSSGLAPVPLRSSSPVLTESIKQSSCNLNRTESKKSNESVILRRKRAFDSSLYSSPSSAVSSSSCLLPQNDASFVTPAKRSRFTPKMHEDAGKVPALSFLASKVHTENLYFSLPNARASSSLETGYSKFESDTQAASSVSLPQLSSHICTLKTSDKTLCPRHLLEADPVRLPYNLAIPTQSTPCTVHENISNLSSVASSHLFPSSIIQTVNPISDISTVSSENLEDVLLSVESCQAHEDPRVRTLASRIISLIHDIDVDGGEDDNVDDGENEGIENGQECEENSHDLEDSGIDLEEE